MVVGHDMAVLVPDEARAGALRHLQHVQREGILPTSKSTDFYRSQDRTIARTKSNRGSNRAARLVM